MWGEPSQGSTRCLTGLGSWNLTAVPSTSPQLPRGQKLLPAAPARLERVELPCEAGQCLNTNAHYVHFSSPFPLPSWQESFILSSNSKEQFYHQYSVAHSATTYHWPWSSWQRRVIMLERYTGDIQCGTQHVRRRGSRACCAAETVRPSLQCPVGTSWAVLKTGSGQRLPWGKSQLSIRRILHRNGGQALEQVAQEAGKPPSSQASGLRRSKPWEAWPGLANSPAWSREINHTSRDHLHRSFPLKLSTGSQVSVLEACSWYGFIFKKVLFGEEKNERMHSKL